MIQECNLFYKNLCNLWQTLVYFITNMAMCINCDKKTRRISWSRHQKGSSGHGGDWNLKAQIHKRNQHPNLHVFHGKKYCTKCLRIVKELDKQLNAQNQTSVAAV